MATAVATIIKRLEARAALVAAQAAPQEALPAADVSEMTIRVNGRDLKLTIVRPVGSDQKTLPAFMRHVSANRWGNTGIMRRK